MSTRSYLLLKTECSITFQQEHGANWPIGKNATALAASIPYLLQPLRFSLHCQRATAFVWPHSSNKTKSRQNQLPERVRRSDKVGLVSPLSKNFEEKKKLQLIDYHEIKIKQTYIPTYFTFLDQKFCGKVAKNEATICNEFNLPVFISKIFYVFS